MSKPTVVFSMAIIEAENDDVLAYEMQVGIKSQDIIVKSAVSKFELPLAKAMLVSNFENLIKTYEASRTTTTEPKCNCKNVPNQVCDVCTNAWKGQLKDYEPKEDVNTRVFGVQPCKGCNIMIPNGQLLCKKCESKIEVDS